MDEKNSETNVISKFYAFINSDMGLRSIAVFIAVLIVVFITVVKFSSTETILTTNEMMNTLIALQNLLFL